MKAFITYLIVIISAIWLSCKEKPDPIDVPDADPVLVGFSPVSGTKGTLIRITGENFGSSTNDILVKINGLSATIKSVKDKEITAVVPDKCGLGAVVVSVKGKNFTAPDHFRYIYKTTTSYFTGGQKGFADGPPASVKFEGPYKIIFDTKGTLYMTDQGNCMVREIALDGTVTSIAGSPHSGFKDGKGDQALMKFPIGIDAWA